MAFRLQVALALVPVLVVFPPDELAMLSTGVSLTPVPPPFDKFADRVEETKAVADFLPKVAAVNLPPLPVVPPPEVVPPLQS